MTVWFRTPSGFGYGDSAPSDGVTISEAEYTREVEKLKAQVIVEVEKASEQVQRDRQEQTEKKLAVLSRLGMTLEEAQHFL